MCKRWYIERTVIAVLLLLLLALAPAKAQNVVNQGETTPLTVEQRGYDTYEWHLYSDSTVNFAVDMGDTSPDYAVFEGGNAGPEVMVKWTKPGTYFFKVTAVDGSGCSMNLKIGKMKVIDVLPVITAVPEPSLCYGANGFISFTITKLLPADYVVKYEGGEFTINYTGTWPVRVEAPAAEYRNLTIEANGLSSYNPNNIVNVEVTQPSEIVITESVTLVDLMSGRKGAITLSVEGGAGNYTYLWSNGATTKDISNLTEGNYTVTVTDDTGCTREKTIRVDRTNAPPVAVDDDFFEYCGTITGNVLKNDTDPEDDVLSIGTTTTLYPKHGDVALASDGTFEYHADPYFTGVDSFRYALFDKNRYPGVYGTVVLTILPDADRDGVQDPPADNLALGDRDADGDGLLNELDGTADEDDDGLPNYLDIDSDGDGILDHYEVQSSDGYVRPSFLDANSNGVDDAYDNFQMTRELAAVDTDGDGTPDFMDLDSDNDHVPDFIEGHDDDANGKPDQVALRADADGDGLDDGYDTYLLVCDAQDNILRSKASMQDFDDDKIPDWRDENDDDDNFITLYEDMNGDGDYSNDDFDFDGHPEYLSKGRECDLFIPDAFSPSGDNIHDLYMIYCINHYPNAKIYIFDHLGNKLYEKENYGNLEVWKTPEAAWWNGTPDRGRGKGEKVAPGTYYYVLDLGNGEVKKSFVFVSY